MSKMRKITTLLVLVTSLAACSSRPAKEAARVPLQDAMPAADSGPPAARVSIDEMRTLFSEAIYCSPKSCMEHARRILGGLMKTAPNDVAMAAIDVLTDPYAATDQGDGQEALFFLNDWFRSDMDDATRHHASDALAKVVLIGNPRMRRVAYSYLSAHRLPNAQRILLAEMENTARDPSDRAIAGGMVGGLVDDTKLMKSWLLDEDPVHLLAALYMFDNLDIDDKEPLYHELRTRLVAIGRRPELPRGVVYELAAFYGHFLAENPDDPEIRPLAERWEKHPDYVAAGQMSKILLEHTDWRPPPR